MSAGIEPLVWDDSLAKIAENYSLEMAREDRFGHIIGHNSVFSDTMEYQAHGEISYMDKGTANDVVEIYILNPKATKIGVGVANDDTNGVGYWTLKICA